MSFSIRSLGGCEDEPFQAAPKLLRDCGYVAKIGRFAGILDQQR
jgi:hypothetical protein